MDGNSTFSCNHELILEVANRVKRELWQFNGIIVLNAIIMGVVVFIGVCASRYRRHTIIGFIFNGANTLFLPIVSLAAGTAMTDKIWNTTTYYQSDPTAIVEYGPALRGVLVLTWTGLVVFVGINAFAAVSGDPREAKNIEPSTELLVKVIWVAYLMSREMLPSISIRSDSSFLVVDLSRQVRTMFIIFVASSLSKIYHKYRVFYVARGSLMLGRNPQLIVSYMAQLDGIQVLTPSLVVMEGGPITLEQQPHGYSFTYGMPGPGHKQNGCKRLKTPKRSELVTLDKVWGLHDTCFLNATPQAKDLCFSFSLMKLLRCRFVKYTVSEAGFTKARNFFWHTYLQSADYSKVFRVITDELSFFHDYHYSSMSIPFFHPRFLFARVFSQVLSIGCCLYIFMFIKLYFSKIASNAQIGFIVYCRDREGGTAYFEFGNRYFDLVPLYFALAAILVTEIKETVSYLCSNFTKVVLICSYVSNRRCRKFVAFVFKYLRCEWLLNNWEDKMSQCKILVFRPMEVSILWRRLVRLPNQKKIKVPSEAKEAIFKALQGLARELHEGQALKQIRFPRSPIPNSATVDAWSECNGKGVADTILAWHIATGIFEVRHPQPMDHLARCKKAAVCLSQYCAYLVGYRPELLPDDVEWCKTLHQAVKKEAARVLAKHGATPAPGGDQFQHLVNSLSVESNHEVLGHGARLAEKLVESRKGWEELAKFWSEMTLYIAPSEKLDEHAEAISRGGELVTLVWALLAHAGIVDRPRDAVASANTSDDAAAEP